MAKSLVDMLAADFKPEKYHDNYRQALLEVIDRKSAGEVIERPAPAAGKVVNLMEALRESVEAARREKGGRAAARNGRHEESEEEAPRSRRKRAG
jgi:DNA end-binding protein Ku